MCNSILKSSDDPFCENLFWKSQNVKTSLHDPACAITGITMAMISILFSNISEECNHVIDSHFFAMFYMIKGFIVTLGIGTFYYHAFSHEYSCLNLWINDHTVDWTSLVLLLLFLTLFYFCIFIQRNWYWIQSLEAKEMLITIWAATMGVWALTLTAAMDSYTENQWRNHFNPNQISFKNITTTSTESGTDTYGTILNVILLVYPGLIFVSSVLVYRIQYEELKSLFTVLFLTVGFYVLNTSLCSSITSFFIFHALYHIIAVVMVLQIACIGLRILYENQLQITFHAYIWPVIFPCKYFLHTSGSLQIFENVRKKYQILCQSN